MLGNMWAITYPYELWLRVFRSYTIERIKQF